jgi:hypothetical protein
MGRRDMNIGFCWGNIKERARFEDLGLRERYNIKMDLEGIEWDDVDLVDLAQDSDRCRTLVNTIMNLRVP